MWEVVQAVDPLKRIRECPLAFEAHAVELCPLHEQLDSAIAAIEKMFTACKISKLIDPNHPSSPLCAYAPKNRAAAMKGRAKR
jgi:DNA-binding IscR family transcriptional regulator